MGLAIAISQRRPRLAADPPTPVETDGLELEPQGLADGEPPSDADGPEGPDPRRPLGRMPVAGLSRRSLAFLLGAVVVAWIVFVFARAVADSAASSDQVDRLRHETVAAAGRLQAAERELAIVQSDDYLVLQARAYGFGRSGERAFGLMADAPSPRPITPLGAEPGSTGQSTPLDDWLDLLFGP